MFQVHLAPPEVLDLGAARACEDEQADDVERVGVQAVSFAFKQGGVQPGQFGGAEEALAVAIRVALDAFSRDFRR